MASLSYYDTSPRTFDELTELAVKKINSKFDDDDNHVVYLAWQGQFDTQVSCSHYAPKGRRTNWGGKNTEFPTCYPGWSGRVWASYKHERTEHPLFWSTFLDETGISGGTGGGGLYDLPEWVNLHQKYREYKGHSIGYGHYPVSYDSRIFKMDFPLLGSEYIEQATKGEVSAKLKRNKHYKYVYPTERTSYVHPDYQRQS